MTTYCFNCDAEADENYVTEKGPPMCFTCGEAYEIGFVYGEDSPRNVFAGTVEFPGNTELFLGFTEKSCTDQMVAYLKENWDRADDDVPFPKNDEFIFEIACESIYECSISGPYVVPVK